MRCAVYVRVSTDKEEQKLVEGFDGYRQYMESTGRFFPKLAGPRG